jgi:hypothetical protein
MHAPARMAGLDGLPRAALDVQRGFQQRVSRGWGGMLIDLKLGADFFFDGFAQIIYRLDLISWKHADRIPAGGWLNASRRPQAGLRSFADNLVRRLVDAQAQEHRLAQQAVVRPLVECDLRDQVGCDEVRFRFHFRNGRKR